ncbi:TPA: hypothetical protein ACGGE8_001405, partial [Vibrio cholerae]
GGDYFKGLKGNVAKELNRSIYILFVQLRSLCLSECRYRGAFRQILSAKSAALFIGFSFS